MSRALIRYNNIKSAVDHVLTMYRENDWDFKYCVGKVANNYQLDYGYLLGLCGRECGKRKRAAAQRRAVANRKESPQMELFGGKR